VDQYQYHKRQVCTKQPHRLRPQCGPISHPQNPELVWFYISTALVAKTSPPSWAALSLPVPLSADAEGSLGIKPRRDVNAAAHGGGVHVI